MRLSLRSAINGATGLVLIGALALGGVWLHDRARRWEVPRWTAGTFVPIRAEERPAGGARATWVAVVNPACANCLGTLRRLHGRWTRAPRAGRLVALIVDTPARPDANALRVLPPIAVWWDRDGVWRRRWGHRVYGELLEFDAAGSHLRTIAGDRALRDARTLAPGASQAPVHEGRGGT